MPIFALDTSCMVAAVCEWHEHHSAATTEIERRLSRGERRMVPAHALAEAYAVLTRLPPPHRLAAADAWTLLESNFVTGCRLVTLPGAAYVRVVKALAQRGIAGGRTADALIGECARRAAARTLLTFNRRHFDPPPAGVTVVEPRT